MTTPDQQLESAIVAAGAAKAPRVTPADIEANIKTEAYFTAADGVRGATPGGLRTYVPEQEHRLLTFCVLTLNNGFTVTGESACASPENFNADIGRRIARENAVQKIWPLMGYELRTKLAAQPLDFRDRVRAEKAELDEKLVKLRAFFDTITFAGLDADEQKRLRAQAEAMCDYAMALKERIDAFPA